MGDLDFKRPISSTYPISSPFNSRGKTHKGVDYAAPIGIPVKASERGLVVRAAENPKTERRPRAYGNVVVINHTPFAKKTERHIYSLYAHLDNMSVITDSIVEKGETIGHSGNTGMNTGPHLHFEILDVGSELNWSSSRGGMGVPGQKGGGGKYRKKPENYFKQLTTAEGTTPKKSRNPFAPRLPIDSWFSHTGKD